MRATTEVPDPLGRTGSREPKSIHDPAPVARIRFERPKPRTPGIPGQHGGTGDPGYVLVRTGKGRNRRIETASNGEKYHVPGLASERHRQMVAFRTVNVSRD